MVGLKGTTQCESYGKQFSFAGNALKREGALLPCENLIFMCSILTCGLQCPFTLDQYLFQRKDETEDITA